MEQHSEENDGVVRLHNRALRNVNRKLRSTVQRLKESSDQEFLAVSTTPTLAEEALKKLWAEAGFDCDPEDYDAIVMLSLRAIDDVRFALGFQV